MATMRNLILVSSPYVPTTPVPTRNNSNNNKNLPPMDLFPPPLTTKKSSSTSRIITPTTSIELYVDYQIQMLRSMDNPSVVISILNLFLDMNLASNVVIRDEAFCNISICYHLSKMLSETKTKPKNPFNCDESLIMKRTNAELDLTLLQEQNNTKKKTKTNDGLYRNSRRGSLKEEIKKKKNSNTETQKCYQ